LPSGEAERAVWRPLLNPSSTDTQPGPTSRAVKGGGVSGAQGLFQIRKLIHFHMQVFEARLGIDS
jgi:hypothetical protein